MKGNTVTLGVQGERNVLKTADLQRLAEIVFMPRNSTYTCILALENTNELEKKKKKKSQTSKTFLTSQCKL